MLATCTLRWASRKSETSCPLIRIASRPPATSAALARVPGEDVRGRVDGHRRVVDRGGGLAETDRDQTHLAGVLRDVPGREHAVQAGLHRGVDDDVPLLHRDPPLLERTEVGDEPERGDERLAGSLDDLAVDAQLDRGEGTVAVAALAG